MYRSCHLFITNTPTIRTNNTLKQTGTPTGTKYEDSKRETRRRRSSTSTLPPGINIEGSIEGIVEDDVSASRPDMIEVSMVPSRYTGGEMKEDQTLKRVKSDISVSTIASPRARLRPDEAVRRESKRLTRGVAEKEWEEEKEFKVSNADHEIGLASTPGKRMRPDKGIRRGSKQLSRGLSARELREESEFKVSTPDSEITIRRAPQIYVPTLQERGQNTMIGYEAMKPSIPSRRGFLVADLPGLRPDRSTPSVRTCSCLTICPIISLKHNTWKKPTITLEHQS